VSLGRINACGEKREAGKLGEQSFTLHHRFISLFQHSIIPLFLFGGKKMARKMPLFNEGYRNVEMVISFKSLYGV